MTTNSTGSILLRRGPSTDRLLFCPLAGEIIYDTTLKQIFVGDGVTYGGIAVGSGGSGSGSGSGSGTSGATGASGATGGTLTKPDILELLSGAITESQLYKDLRDRIDLIDAPASIVTSVSGRIKVVQDIADGLVSYAASLDDQIQSEAATRAQQLLDEAATRAAAINNETTIRQSEINSIASQITTLTASVDGSISAIRSEQTAQANSVSTVASSISTIAARLDNFNNTTLTAEAWVNTEQTARIHDNTVISESITALSAQVGDQSSTISSLLSTSQSQAQSLVNLTTRTSTAESSITNLQTTTADQAQTLDSLSTRTSNAESSISSLNTTSVSMASSISQLVTRASNAESSISSINETNNTTASAITQLQTRVATAETNIFDISTTTASSAETLSYLSTRVGNAESTIAGLSNTTASSAQSITQLSSRLNNINGVSLEQAVSTQANSINDILGEYTLKIDVNGRVSGFGLMSSTTESSFGVNADRFWISAPADFSGESPPTNPFNGETWFNTIDKHDYVYNGTNWVLFQPIIPFVVQTTPTIINGYVVEPGIYMDSATIRNGSISNAKIGNYIQSDNFTNSPGSFAGWRIDKSGAALFNSITIKDSDGNIVMSSGGAVWDYTVNKPETLSQLDLTAGTKLAGISEGATRNVYVGNWSLNTTYIIGDVVLYNDGNTWMCQQSHVSSNTKTPPNYPTTSNTYWIINSAKGEDAIYSIVDNESHTFSATIDGVVSDYVGSGTTIAMYEGSTLLSYTGVGTTVSLNGTWKVEASATNITCGSITDSGDFLTVYDHSAMSDFTDVAYITYTISGKRLNGKEFSITTKQTFSKSKAGTVGTSPIIFEITISSPVIIKAADSASSVGTYDSISVQGKKHNGNVTTDYGWFTVTPTDGVESTTAIDTANTPLIINTDSNSGISGYNIKMYNQATVNTASLLDSQYIPVVYKGSDGKAYLVVIESTNGTEFRVGQSTNTLLKAYVFLNGINITDTINAGWFRWRRVSLLPKPIPNDDNTWNSLYQSGYKQISINVDDVDAKATFFCDIIDPNN